MAGSSCVRCSAPRRQTSPTPADDPSRRVIAERDGAAGRITLDRPEALNALDLPMFRAVEGALAAWAGDAAVEHVVVRGVGRAFCAGGDIRAVRDAAARGDRDYLDALYLSEYRGNATVSRYRKPYIALIGGVCMGGGMGLAMYGSHRIVTERAVLAMPETGIGFFPDVGCTYVLPRLPGRIGWYLGLTGRRMDAGDALWCGLATHAVPHARLGACDAALAAGGASVDAIVARFAEAAPPARLADEAAAVARCFSAPSVDGVLAELAAENTAWARETLATLERASPSALVVTWALFERGAGMTLAQCLAMERAAGARMIAAHDFGEGVRAAVVDKDRRPAWLPARLDGVDAAALTAMVDACAAAAAAPGGAAAFLSPEL